MATENIPSRLHCVAEGNVLTGANEILDDDKGKKQSVINQESDQRLETLETAVGTGGSVDSRIESAKTEIVGGASSDCNTLGKAEELISTNANDISALQEAYAGLTQNDVVVVAPSDTWPVATPAQNTIYRVVDRTNTPPQYYTDYMWNGTAMVEMAQYNNAIDAIPTAGSHNLVESGGVQNELALGAVYDVSAHNSGATFASLEALLSNANLDTLIPTSVRKGGMSIKFVQSSDNKYVQYRCMAQNFTTDVTQWQGVDEEPIDGSDNLVKSGGVADKLNTQSSFSVFLHQNGQVASSIKADFAMGTGKKFYLHFDVSNNVQTGITLRSEAGGSATIVQTISTNKTWSVGHHILPFTYSGGTWLRFDDNSSWSSISNVSVYGDLTEMSQLDAYINVNLLYGNPSVAYASANDARQAVPESSLYRRTGQVICYKLSSGWVTERFISNDYSAWLNDSAWSNEAEKNKIEFNNGGIQINANSNQGTLLKTNGDTISNSSFNTSDFIIVNQNDKVVYTGVMPNESFAAVVGYDEQKSNPTVLLKSDYGVKYVAANSITISSASIKYVRVCCGNNTRVDYQQEKIVIIKDATFQNITLDVEEQGKEIESIKEFIYKENTLDFDLTADPNNKNIMWGKLPTFPTKVHVKGITGIVTFSSTAPSLQIRTSRGGTTIRTVELSDMTGSEFIFDLSSSDLSSGATYFRLAYLTYENENDISVTYNINNLLQGKKISIIGDSISTIYNNTTPYYKVQSIDVGQEIQSYVTWWDVWGNAGGTMPTGKKIGGVSLTSEMIGSLQTFTPNSNDVGKEIGVAPVYNTQDVKVWSEVLCEKTGAILLANASWSGGRICKRPEESNSSYVLSEAWSDYTISRCKVKNSSGNDVIPDVIIIYRGVNDFSHSPYAYIDDISLSNGIPNTDYIDSKYEYKAGYYKTIQKLRTAYPKAYIILCTLNVFKRVTYDVFPTRNGIYTLPDMNDAIREIANTMGCGLIEFDKDGITFENCYSEGYITDSATDSTHPNSKGHAVMAEKAISDITYLL